LKVKELIDVLNPGEVKVFRQYLLSPFYNNSQQLRELFELLLSENETSKDVLFRKIFGHGKYDDKKLRYLFSDLTAHLEKFITLIEFEKDEEEFSIYRQKSLSIRNAEKAYSLATKKIPAKQKSENAVSYLNAFRSIEISNSFDAKHQSRLSQLNYSSLLKNLDRFYFTKKLQLQCELINLKNVLNNETEVILIDPICEYIKANEFLDSPLTEIYYHILITLKNSGDESEESFRKVLALTNEHQRELSIEDMNNIYQYEKNFCIRKINKGEDNYRQILFDLYKTILSSKRIMDHDYFSQWEFKNIVTLGLRLKEGGWVKNFISKYINFLPPHERKNALTYNTAMLYYYKKSYKFVLKYLQEVEFTDLYYQLDSKSILLKVYFETDEQEVMLHHIAAFKVFLSRNKNISGYQLSIYKNFIRYSLKIFRAGTNSKKLLALKEEITSSPNISDRNWLLERINDVI
jgi:hypothetical protein